MNHQVRLEEALEEVAFIRSLLPESDQTAFDHALAEQYGRVAEVSGVIAVGSAASEKEEDSKHESGDYKIDPERKQIIDAILQSNTTGSTVYGKLQRRYMEFVSNGHNLRAPADNIFGNQTMVNKQIAYEHLSRRFFGKLPPYNAAVGLSQIHISLHNGQLQRADIFTLAFSSLSPYEDRPGVHTDYHLILYIDDSITEEQRQIYKTIVSDPTIMIDLFYVDYPEYDFSNHSVKLSYNQVAMIRPDRTVY